MDFERFFVEDDDVAAQIEDEGSAEAPSQPIGTRDNAEIIEEYRTTCQELLETEKARDDEMPLLKALMDQRRANLFQELIARGLDVVKVPECENMGDVADEDDSDAGSQFSLGSQGIGKRRFLRVVDTLSHHSINEKSIGEIFHLMKEGSASSSAAAAASPPVRAVGFDMVLESIVEKCGGVCSSFTDAPPKKKGKKGDKSGVSFKVEGDEAAQDTAEDVEVNIADVFVTCLERAMKGHLNVRVPNSRVELSKSRPRTCKLTDLELEEYFESGNIATMFREWVQAKIAHAERSKHFSVLKQQLTEAKSALTEEIVMMAPNAMLAQIEDMTEDDQQVFMATPRLKVEIRKFLHKTTPPIKTTEFMDEVKKNVKTVVRDVLECSPVFHFKRGVTADEVRVELREGSWDELVKETATALQTWRTQRDVIVEAEVKIKVK
jgi:hypothetical protein